MQKTLNEIQSVKTRAVFGMVSLEKSEEIKNPLLCQRAAPSQGVSTGHYLPLASAEQPPEPVLSTN